jgi:hypothetical protein
MICSPLPPHAARSTGGNAMIALVALLWACGIMPGTCAIPGEPWLPTLRERLEQAQKAVEEPKPWTARDRERQEFVRRWLELRMAKEKAAHEAQ